MSPLSHEQYLSLRGSAELLEADHHGDKVLRLADASILKLFRRKRWISSSLLRPYAARFAGNAKALEDRQIPCPKVIAIYNINSIKRTAVHYWPLPGMTLRQCISQLYEHEVSVLFYKLGAFIARLHDKGVYFRSLHFGNVVYTEDTELGLIDIADMHCSHKPLNRNKRKRNFQHMLRYPADTQHLLQHKNELITGYCDHLPHQLREHFAEYLNRKIK